MSGEFDGIMRGEYAEFTTSCGQTFREECFSHVLGSCYTLFQWLLGESVREAVARPWQDGILRAAPCCSFPARVLHVSVQLIEQAQDVAGHGQRACGHAHDAELFSADIDTDADGFANVVRTREP